MLVTVAAHKGGVAKTTTSVHLAALLQQDAPTLLIDEEGAGATDWADHGHLPFRTVLEAEAARHYAAHQHHVIDTGARITPALLRSLSSSSDFLVIPTTPDALALSALVKMLDALRALSASRYGILLTITPPRPSRDAEDARAALSEDLGLSVLEAVIPRAVAFQKAALAGVTVDQVRDPRAAEAWASYASVAKEIQERVR